LGQWANAFKSMPPLERPGQEQSGPVGIEPATNGAQKVTEPAAKDVQKDIETAAFPVEGYDEMNVGEVSERLDGLSEAELKRVGKYEKDNKDRGTLRKEMEQKTETTS
jgi:LysM repeat protein